MYTILVLEGCPFCHASEDLFRKKGIKYEVFVFTDRPSKGQFHKKNFKAKYGDHATFPRILKDDKHIGGHSELVKLLSETIKRN
jgi:glutaredoxin